MGLRTPRPSPFPPDLIKVPQWPPSPPYPPHLQLLQFSEVAEDLLRKLILDSDSDYFLLLPFFDRTPVSRDIACQSLVKISEILAGANLFLMRSSRGVDSM